MFQTSPACHTHTLSLHCLQVALDFFLQAKKKPDFRPQRGKNCYLLLSGSLSRRHAKDSLIPSASLCDRWKCVCNKWIFLFKECNFSLSIYSWNTRGGTRAGRACLGIHAARLMKSTARQFPRKESLSVGESVLPLKNVGGANQKQRGEKSLTVTGSRWLFCYYKTCKAAFEAFSSISDARKVTLGTFWHSHKH